MGNLIEFSLMDLVYVLDTGLSRHFFSRPFSVKAFGKALVFANFVVGNFDRKIFHRSCTL